MDGAVSVPEAVRVPTDPHAVLARLRGSRAVEAGIAASQTQNSPDSIVSRGLWPSGAVFPSTGGAQVVPESGASPSELERPEERLDPNTPVKSTATQRHIR